MDELGAYVTYAQKIVNFPSRKNVARINDPRFPHFFFSLFCPSLSADNTKNDDKEDCVACVNEHMLNDRFVVRSISSH